MSRTHAGPVALITVIVLLLTLTSYACRQSASKKNADGAKAMATPASSPAQIVVPPWPKGFPPSVPPATVSGNLLWSVPLPQQINTPLQIRPNFDYFSCDLKS